MNSIQSLIRLVEPFAREHLATCKENGLVFHTLNHTREVIENVRLIGSAEGLSVDAVDTIVLAAWFHDLGYTVSYKGHEEESKKIAEKFLKKHDASEQLIEEVKDIIEVTKLGVEAESIAQKIIKDADLHNLATPHALTYSDMLREEWKAFKDTEFSELKWLKFNHKFYKNYAYLTDYAKENFNPGKAKNTAIIKDKIKNLNTKKQKKGKNKKKSILSSDSNYLKMELSLRDDKIKKLSKKLKRSKIQRPDRGIETMFRTTYRTHIALSSFADSKANILLSINAIILSIISSSIFTQIIEYPPLVFPTMVLMAVCLATIVFAILSTRPKVSHGIFTRQDILNKKTNLLFFGNFYRMPLEDYSWGISEMMKDSEYLYGSMTKDIYFLGVVLAKKYRYLRIAYNIFMYGILVSVPLFVLFFWLKSGEVV